MGRRKSGPLGQSRDLGDATARRGGHGLTAFQGQLALGNYALFAAKGQVDFGLTTVFRGDQDDGGASLTGKVGKDQLIVARLVAEALQ